MELYRVEFIENIAKYIQICEHIKKLINERKILDGERLPTIRELSSILGVNKITVVNSYKRLQSEGFAYQKMGSGTYAKRKDISDLFKLEYIKEIKKMKRNKNKIIDFTGESNKDIFFPIDNFKVIINRVLDRDGAEALTTQESLGYSNLRRTINKVFWNSKLDINNILIVSGAQQGIDIAAKAILNINDNVIVEKPTYGGALSVFKWRGANIFEVPISKNGIDIDGLEEILKKNKIKCFYMMSYFQNPTGISYNKEIKIRILELAEKYDFYIIEDDYLSELIYFEDMVHEPFKKLDTNERVIYIRSFSKIFLPGIRLGYIVYPNILKEVMHSSKVNTDIATSTLMQRSLELYIKEGYANYHIEDIKEHYYNKYNYMKELINSELSTLAKCIDPKGGLSFYFKLYDTSINTKELFYRLIKRGVYITPGNVFYTNIDDGLNEFRINFSQVTDEEIYEGIIKIKEELRGWHTLL